MQQSDPLTPLLGSAASPLQAPSLSLLAALQPFDSKLQKAAWQDLIRDEDAKQMDVLIAKLDAMRVQQAPVVPTAAGPKKDAKGEHAALTGVMMQLMRSTYAKHVCAASLCHAYCCRQAARRQDMVWSSLLVLHPSW